MLPIQCMFWRKSVTGFDAQPGMLVLGHKSRKNNKA